MASKQHKLSRNKRTEAAKRRIAEQPARTTINKRRKLLHHQVRHPNDLQVSRGK